MDLVQEGKMTYTSHKSDSMEKPQDTSVQYKSVPHKEQPKKVTVLDTSVLVKPSQLPRGGVAAKKQAEYMKD